MEQHVEPAHGEPAHGEPAHGDVGAETFALLVADVYEAAGVLRRMGERTAATQGQTQARWQVLSVVSDGNWTVPLAADRLGTSRQAVQRIANELVDDCLAVFEENPRHRRSPFLRLTPYGSASLDAITEQARLSNSRALADLGDVDLALLRAALGKLTSAVRRQFQGAGAVPT